MGFEPMIPNMARKDHYHVEILRNKQVNCVIFRRSVAFVYSNIT
jgi:hypothetical protein